MTSEFITFSSQYDHVAKLCEEGSGTVWLVRKISDNSLHTAKIIPAEKCERKTWCEETQEFYPDEIFLTQTLEHAGLQVVEEIYYVNSWWIVVTEFQPCFKILSQHVAQTRLLSEEKIRDIILQLLGVVDYLADFGIDHRDINADNILYSPSTNQIKLVNFEQASVMPKSRYFTFQGTPELCPPEFLTYGSYSSVTGTTWTIGCLAHTLLNGLSPILDSRSRRTEECKVLPFRNSKRSQLADDFLQSLLVVNDDCRKLPNQIYLHPWMISSAMD